MCDVVAMLKKRKKKNNLRAWESGAFLKTRVALWA
jgi:hypothetical protein